MTKTIPGRFYERGRDGAYREVGPRADRAPEVWVCRRVADFPPGTIPPHGAEAFCARCGAAIVYNPATREPTMPAHTPKVCMQCAGITPLPL